jgi:hypothetical protein
VSFLLTAALGVGIRSPEKESIRTDYWAQLILAQLWACTCYVAHELAGSQTTSRHSAAGSCCWMSSALGEMVSRR